MKFKKGAKSITNNMSAYVWFVLKDTFLLLPVLIFTYLQLLIGYPAEFAMFGTILTLLEKHQSNLELHFKASNFVK